MKIKMLATAAIALALSACSFVQVPPAQVGKILSPDGYSKEVLSPGKYTLAMREDLVLLDTATNTYTENVKVILDDKLTIHVDVRFRGRIRNDQRVLNTMFNDLTHGGDFHVSFGEVYRVYGQAAVRNKTREVVSKYTVEDVHSNYARISMEVSDAIEAKLVGTPIELSDTSLGNIQYPEIVTQAVAKAKERKMDLEREEAQAAIDLLKKTNELALIEANHEIEMTKARTISEANKRIGENITPELLELKRIEVNRIIAESANKGQVIYMPVESMSSVGAQVKMFN